MKKKKIEFKDLSIALRIGVAGGIMYVCLGLLTIVLTLQAMG